MDNKFGVATKAIIKNNGEYLIVFKSDTEEISPNEVDIPGGRVEFGEEVEAGLKREIKEELGIEIEIKNPSRVWGFVKENLHLIGITFLAEYVGGEINLSGEHTHYKWVSKDEILKGEYPKWLKKEFAVLP